MRDNFTNYSLDACLDNLNLEIMLSNVTQQISKPEDIVTDFLSIVQDKWKDIEDNCEDQDTLTEIKYKLIDFWGEVIYTIDSTFDLCMDYEANSLSSQEVAIELYQFFALDRLKNIEEFFINYISANKVVISQTLGINEKGKDVTSIACRRKDIDKTSIPIIANIDRVINFICDSELEVEELLNYSNSDNGDVMEDMYMDNMINNNFYYTYIQDVMSKYDGLISSRIRNNIRASLYK